MSKKYFRYPEPTLPKAESATRLKLGRREFIGSSAALLALSTTLSPFYEATISMANAATPFALPSLPYAPESLEPTIDTETMKIHHGKHHQAYVDKLNEQATKLPELGDMPLERMMAQISKYPAPVRNNGGGHFNHSLFWNLMAPQGKGGAPSKTLSDKITSDIGGMDAMKEALNNAAIARFGSGWGWLILTADKKLAISSTPNQDNPLMDVAELKGTPIIGIDVWEHAYYLKYQNKRADYLKNWWTVANWNTINQLFEQASK
jgi:Fe-Mn family superoxide dismutase